MFPDMHSAQLSAFFAIRQTGFVARTTYDNSTHCLSFKAPPYATFQDGKWYVLRTPKQCPVFARAMICQETQYELIQFDDCLNSRRTKTSTCPLVSCNTDAYISTPAGLLLRTNSTAIKIVSHKSSEQGTSHPHMQTISSVAERRMPDHQVTFVKWDQNTTSVSFGDIVIHSPENAAPNSIMYRKPPLLVPRIDREGMIKIPGLGAESLAKDVINFQADLKELREEQKSDCRPARCTTTYRRNHQDDRNDTQILRNSIHRGSHSAGILRNKNDQRLCCSKHKLVSSTVL